MFLFCLVVLMITQWIIFIVSGLPKPVSVEQKILFGMVLGVVEIASATAAQNHYLKSQVATGTPLKTKSKCEINVVASSLMTMAKATFSKIRRKLFAF